MRRSGGGTPPIHACPGFRNSAPAPREQLLAFFADLEAHAFVVDGAAFDAGEHHLVGSLVGGLILAMIEVYGVALTSSNFQSILIYGVFIAMLVWRPQGLFGTRRAA